MLLIISGSASLAYAQTYSGAGQGTIEAPYIIENAEQLQGIRNNLSAHYRLGSDIDLENQYWQPVGESNNPFKGSLDGDGHKIKNLTIKNQSYAGLFAYGDGAVLKNITIENVNISEGKMTYAGGLIGYINNGQVEDCAVEGNIVIKSDSSSGTSYIGGMIGRSNSSTVKNNQVNGDLSIETNSNNGQTGGMIGNNSGGTIEGCEVKGKAYINSSSQYVGGLAGYSYGAVINSQVTAAGLIKGKNNVGGLVGYGRNSIEGSSSSIDVEGENIVGGLAGYFYGTTISKSFATGNVVSDAGKAGGLIGQTSVTDITRSYATGDVESNGVSSEYIGGIVGYSASTVNIEDSFALGDIRGNKYVGGLVGQVGASSTLKTSYTVGEVKGNLNVGVLSGGSLSSSNITSCYNASHKAQLIKQVNGFDYENIWDIEEGATYSYLREVDKPDKVKIGKEQYEGSGTEADPYIIETQEQLLGVKNNPGKHFAMINDIDLEMAAIEPLTGTVPFSGSFDGGDHVIKNVSINGTGNVGLFGSCKNAVIKNLRVENIDVRGGSYIGSLIGEMEGGRVENCHISSGIVFGSTAAGGLIGYNKGGDIADSSAEAEVYGGSYAGGLIGMNALGGEISGSQAKGTINSGSSKYSGGLIGYLGSNASKESRISNSCASGNVGKSSGRYAGGLVGSVAGAGSTVIESSYADCEIGYSSCYYVGGLIGYNSSTGALAVENSFASGIMQGSNYAGGIIGYSASGSITNSYSLCQLSGSGSKNGIAPGTVSMVSSYFDLDQAGVSTPVEQAKTSSQLKTEATYENWDFINTWGIEAGSYPYLRDVEGISQPIYLVAPIQLTAEYVTPVSVKLTWNNQATAEAYDVSYNDKIAASDTAEIVINELQPDTTYEFIIRARNYNMKSPWSEPITVTTLSDTQLAPSNLTASLVTATCIELTWDPQAGAETYEIDFQNEILTSDSHTYLIEQLMPQTEYNFRVRSRIGSFASTWSTQLTVSSSAPAAAAGTLEDPILIYTTNDLLAVAQNLSACYRLERDIDLQNQSLQPLGTSTTPFTGNFNGNGHSINNLLINLPTTDNVGLFGYTNQAIIQDLKLNKVDITGSTNVGALIGYMNGGAAQNCSITGVKNISGTTESRKIIGQLAGEAQVSNCTIEEFLLGASAAEKNLTIVQDNSQILSLNVSDMPHNLGKIYVLKYNPEEIQITDLAAQTLGEDTQPGVIAGTGIEILSHKNGVIRFKVDKSRYTDKAWTGVLTIIKFKPLTTGTTIIQFEME